MADQAVTRVVAKQTHTERIDEVLRDVLQGEDASKLLSGLSEGDKDLLYELMNDLRREGGAISDDLWLVDYIRKPPTMEEFVMDPYWLGGVLVPGEFSKGLFPTWRERLIQDFDLDSRIHNIVITGSLGIGKTYISSIIFLYRIVLAALLRYPERFFGLSKGSRIYYVLLSITRAAVNDTIFGDVQNFMANCPFFMEECGYDPDRKYADLKINLGKGIFVTAGSKGWHVIGRNTMGVALDEGNWRIEANPDQRAYELYGEVRQRIKNRFQQITGHLPAISILASSARDESAFTEQVITEIQTNNNPATEIIYRYASYEIKDRELRPNQRWFRVTYGLKNIEPSILAGFYDRGGARKDGPFEDPPTGAQTKYVPEDFMPEFKRNLKSALQAICGVSTGGSHLFFGNTIELEFAIQAGDRVGMRNPADVELIPTSIEDNMEVWDYLQHDRFLTRRAGAIVPLRDPDALRFVHLDMATESVAGIAVCHAIGRTEVKGIFNPEIPFQLFNEYRVVTEFDFVLAIVAGKSRPISFEKVMRFFFWLREKCNYRFASISADQFQCLDGGALVSTGRGIIPIREVVVGDTVSSRSGYNKVYNTVSYPNAPRLRVITDRGTELVGTPPHRVWAASADPSNRELSKTKLEFGWKHLADLKIGDAIWECGKSSVGAREEVVLPALDGPLEGSCNMEEECPYVVPKTLNAEFAQWLGLYWGDGWSVDMKPDKWASYSRSKLAICANDEDYDDLLAAWKSIGWPVHEGGCRVPNIVCYSRRVYRWFEDCGFIKSPQKGPKGTGRMEMGVPELILRSPPTIQAAFLRGLFSADGHVCPNDGQVSLSTKHCRLAHDVQVMLEACWGIQSRVAKYFRAFKKGDPMLPFYRVTLKGSRGEYASNIGFCYKSKSSVMEKHINRPGRSLYIRVVGVEILDPGDVYDLGVEEDPSYFANGFMNHNSVLPLEIFETRGFKTKKTSVDITKLPYYSFRSAFMEKRIRMYRSNLFMKEAEHLIEGPKKVDHPPAGSKDLADAACGAHYDLINSDVAVGVGAASLPALMGPDATQDEQPPVDVMPTADPHREVPMPVYEV